MHFIFLSLSFVLAILFSAEIFPTFATEGRREKGVGKKYFYIYEWSTDVIDRWPFSNTHKRQSIDLKFRANYGLGPSINAEVGIHHTHQYSLFRTFYHRYLHSSFSFPVHTSVQPKPDGYVDYWSHLIVLWIQTRRCISSYRMTLVWIRVLDKKMEHSFRPIVQN